MWLITVGKTVTKLDKKFWLAALLVAGAYAGCGGNASVGGDSETHFLQRCEDECDGGLTCICGICTRRCEDDADCSSLPGSAECFDSTGDTCNSPSALCEVNCSDDSDCKSLGADHYCDTGRGACRAGGTIGSGGSAGAGGSGGTSTTTSSGGSGGTTSVGGTSPSTGGTGGSAGAGGNCDCLESAIEWGIEGGLGSPPQRYSLSDCLRFDLASPRETASCTSELPGCGVPLRPGELEPKDINAAIEDSDVQAALELAPVVYGVDATPVDGEVFAVTIDGQRIVVGYPCPDDSSTCLPIPSGVQNLQLTLDRVVMQQINWENCEQELLCGEPADPGPCDADQERWYFNEASHRCELFGYGGCLGNANNFESLSDCMQACDNDPCSYGLLPADDDYCPSGSVTAEGFCFENSGMACECACFADGGSLDDCVILDEVPGQAQCVPKG